MTSRQSKLRLRQFEVEERRQKISDIQHMITDFSRIAADLDQQVRAEEQRAGISDITHFSYPIYAKAARQRRDNLLSSITDLERKLIEVRAELEKAGAELEKVAMIEGRESDRGRSRIARFTDIDLSDERDLST
jgi:flagellar FliJ protein